MSAPNHNDEHADGIVEDRKQAPPAYFNLLFFGLIAWGVVFIAYFLFSGWSSHGEFAEKMAAHTGQPVAETPAAPAPVQTASAPAVAAGGINAAELFAANCAGCHGANGEGAFGPDLTASSFKYGRDFDSVETSITGGRPKSMPAFSGRLSGAEISALAHYVIAL